MWNRIKEKLLKLDYIKEELKNIASNIKEAAVT